MFRLKPFYLFLTVTVFSVFFISACSSDVPTENGGGTEVTPDNPSKPNVTPVNEFPKNPMALLGIYDVTHESINGQEKAVAEGSEFRVNVDTSKLNQQKVEVLMRLNIDNKLLDMKREVSLAGENLDEKFFNKTFTNLGAKVTGKYTLEFTMKGDSYPELVKEGIITNNDTLVILLDKTKDLAIGTGLDDKPVTPEEIPVTDIIIDTPTDKKFFKGSTVRVDFSLQPITTTDTKVSWQTDKGQSGEVTAVNGKGSISIKNVTETCVLTVKTVKNHQKTFNIQVVDELTEIIFPQTSYKLEQNQKQTIIVDNYDVIKDVLKSLKYNIESGNDIVTLNSDTGEVQGKKNGVAVIKATAVTTNGKTLTATYELDVLGLVDFSSNQSFISSAQGTYEVTFFGTNPGKASGFMGGQTEVPVTTDCEKYKELFKKSECKGGGFVPNILVDPKKFVGLVTVKINQDGSAVIHSKILMTADKMASNSPNDQYQYSVYRTTNVTDTANSQHNVQGIKGRHLTETGEWPESIFDIRQYKSNLTTEIILYSHLKNKKINIPIAGEKTVNPETYLVLNKISSKVEKMDYSDVTGSPFNKVTGINPTNLGSDAPTY